MTVDYTTVAGTATATADYTTTTGTLIFAAGDRLKTITVPTINDTLDEITETFTMQLSNAPNAALPPAQALKTGSILDNDNEDPSVALPATTDLSGTPKIGFGIGETVKLTVTFTDPGSADSHEAIIDWGDGTTVDRIPVAPVGGRAFERTHAYTSEGFYQISVSVSDADGGSGSGQRFVTVSKAVVGPTGKDAVGLVNPRTGVWRLYDSSGAMATEFYFGNPGDVPFMGDWNGDGIETPGLYRQSDGYVYLRNTNTEGVADIKFFFGNPGDVPIAGDFNNDGKDTVSIYRPSNQTFYIINKLGSNDGGLGAAEFSYVFGNPGDRPFVGDFDGDGFDTVGLHRESTGLVYFRNSHTQGIADHQFIYGNPGDQIVAGDWNGDGIDSPALYRSLNQMIYFRHTNTQGIADAEFDSNLTGWIPVAGVTGV